MPGAGPAPIIPMLPAMEFQQAALPGVAIQAGIFFFFLIKTDSSGCQGWQGTQGHLLLAALFAGNEEFAM